MMRVSVSVSENTRTKIRQLIGRDMSHPRPRTIWSFTLIRKHIDFVQNQIHKRVDLIDFPRPHTTISVNLDAFACGYRSRPVHMWPRTLWACYSTSWIVCWSGSIRTGLWKPLHSPPKQGGTRMTHLATRPEINCQHRWMKLPLAKHWRRRESWGGSTWGRAAWKTPGWSSSGSTLPTTLWTPSCLRVWVTCGRPLCPWK